MSTVTQGSLFLPLTLLEGICCLMPSSMCCFRSDHSDSTSYLHLFRSTCSLNLLILALKPSQSAFLYRVIFLGCTLLTFGRMVDSTRTMLWSLKPGMVDTFETNVGLFVQKRSSIFSPLVGVSTSCCRLWSSRISVKVLYRVGSLQSELGLCLGQSILGILKSPNNQVILPLLETNESDLFSSNRLCSLFSSGFYHASN